MEGAGGLSTLANPSLTQPFVNLCEGIPERYRSRVSCRLARSSPPLRSAAKDELAALPYRSSSFLRRFLHSFGDHDSAPAPTLCINTLTADTAFSGSMQRLSRMERNGLIAFTPSDYSISSAHAIQAPPSADYPTGDV